jgi:hypothetical protein
LTSIGREVGRRRERASVLPPSPTRFEGDGQLHHQAPGLGVKFDFFRKVGFIEQGLWNSNAP